MVMEFAGAGDKTQARATDQHEEVHSNFMNELRATAGTDYYKPSPEYKNGLASQNLIGLEKWVDDSKHCGAINQDELASRVADFAKKTDAMWQKMESNPKDFVRMSQDQWLTYPRFNKIFDELDESQRNKVLETLPWSLRAGE
jgi:hypothetical protein